MSLDALYQEIILEHYKNPHNFGKMENPQAEAHYENPSCGDQIDLQILIDAGQIKDIKFSGRGCAISQSSASMMTLAVQGKSVAEAEKTIQVFLNMMTGKGKIDVDLGDLESLQGVRKFPVRVKCATLAWTALQTLLDQSKTKE